MSYSDAPNAPPPNAAPPPSSALMHRRVERLQLSETLQQFPYVISAGTAKLLTKVSLRTAGVLMVCREGLGVYRVEQSGGDISDLVHQPACVDSCRWSAGACPELNTHQRWSRGCIGSQSGDLPRYPPSRPRKQQHRLAQRVESPLLDASAPAAGDTAPACTATRLCELVADFSLATAPAHLGYINVDLLHEKPVTRFRLWELDRAI